MSKLAKLKPGDLVEIIAPASRCSNERLEDLRELLTSWQLNCIIDKDIFGSDLLCANTDEIRFRSLKNALQNTESKAVICARGGYGSMRLIPKLAKIIPPTAPKIFVGMSDITAIQLFLRQNWQWPTIFGALARGTFSLESIAAMKALLFGEIDQIELIGLPLNSLAEQKNTIDTTITGGNLCLVQTSVGTIWQINGQNKIVFLEEVGERGYRVDRMLEHLTQAGIFKNVAAIIFGDFINGNEPDGSSLIEPVLTRFAQSCRIPVIQIKGIGHGFTNVPIPMGTRVTLQLGKKSKLTCLIKENTN